MCGLRPASAQAAAEVFPRRWSALRLQLGALASPPHGPAMAPLLVLAVAVMVLPRCLHMEAALQTTGCGSEVLAQLTTSNARAQDALALRA